MVPVKAVGGLLSEFVEDLRYFTEIPSGPVFVRGMWRRKIENSLLSMRVHGHCGIDAERIR